MMPVTLKEGEMMGHYHGILEDRTKKVPGGKRTEDWSAAQQITLGTSIPELSNGTVRG